MSFMFKGVLDKYNIYPDFYQKSWDLYTIRSVGIGNDCTLVLILVWLACEEILIFLVFSIFQSRLL